MKFTNRETAIMHEAFMIGRIYATQGEKERPAEINDMLLKKCEHAAKESDKKDGHNSRTGQLYVSVVFEPANDPEIATIHAICQHLENDQLDKDAKVRIAKYVLNKMQDNKVIIGEV